MKTKRRRPVTVPDIVARKSQSQEDLLHETSTTHGCVNHGCTNHGCANGRITALTAYDFTFATLLDRAGVDILLVGDSVASVVQGEKTTIPATLEQLIYHTRCVSRGVSHALVVSDLPFLSYQVSPSQARESAGRMLKEGGASAVKLEGGVAMAENVAAITAIDIPVMGHIGLTPQSYHRMGGHRVQGRTSREDSLTSAGTAEQILDDAHALVDAGCFSIVLEGIPEELAARITKSVPIPTIGIGAGAACDGQILVCYDMLGLTTTPPPSFVKQYASLGAVVQQAAADFISEVSEGSFPLSAEGEKESSSPVRSVA